MDSTITLSFDHELRAEDYRALFDRWLALNPEAADWLLTQAEVMQATHGLVATKYLVEKLRYDSGVPIVHVPFVDERGTVRSYGTANAITPLVGRWLRESDPTLNVRTSRSMFDGEVA